MDTALSTHKKVEIIQRKVYRNIKLLIKGIRVRVQNNIILLTSLIITLILLQRRLDHHFK